MRISLQAHQPRDAGNNPLIERRSDATRDGRNRNDPSPAAGFKSHGLLSTPFRSFRIAVL